MISNNSEIETLFANFTVDQVAIPVKFGYYKGTGEPYIVYSVEDYEEPLNADNELQAYVIHYDIDIYAKANYLAIADAVIDKMVGAGWEWMVSRTSPDFYEPDTGYFHKTLNFAKEKEISWQKSD